MKFSISKITIDGIDRLPDITETEIWKHYDTEKPAKSIVVVAQLYIAVEKRENYYQDHTPTAFGNPDYAMIDGIVMGIKIAADIEEKSSYEKIVFRKGKRVILVVDKVNRPKSYYETNREIREALNNL